MYVKILVETRLKKSNMTFTYYAPSNMRDQMEVGKRVLVNFSSRIVEGFIVDFDKKPLDYEAKEIIKVIDEKPVLNKELLELGKFISEKYLCSLISAYQAMLPKALKAKAKDNSGIKCEKYVALAADFTDEKVKIKQQIAIINYLKDNKTVLKSSIKSKSSLQKLIDENIVVEIQKEVYRLKDEPCEKQDNFNLTKDQQMVVKSVVNRFGTSKTILLHGVTGSGKTEVYMSLVEETLKTGKTSIILVPEISLTPQITSRFKKKFGSSVAILHSSLSDGEKYDEYRRIQKKEAKIVIGARSAVFAPLSNLGIIIIDEEHADTYKQENNPRYHALDIAIKRSQTHNCPVLLGSATPTVETYARAQKGYYDFLELSSRVNNRKMPKVTIVDMKKEIRKNNNLFSELLMNKISEKLNKEEQVMLLLNKRGYSNYLMCLNCGYVHKCPNCDITLTYHKTSQMMRCHYCGYASNKMIKCPSCKSDNIKAIGSGTEKIEEELKRLFKEARILRMDADTTSTKGSHAKIINDFNDKKYDVLIGTQMISKGLDFPNVSLVGVINGDTSLNIPNFRSSEATFSLLNQVVGRAGRKDVLGEAIIQTYNPEHYSILCASNHDYKSFYNEEIKIRKKLNYPPYCFIILIKISSKDFNTG
ncbi:MAG: primosomal protein N', partial [Bacilli bacterium]